MKVDSESGLSKLTYFCSSAIYRENANTLIRDWQFVGGFGFVKFWQLEWFNQIVDFIAPIQVGINFLNRQFYSFSIIYNSFNSQADSFFARTLSRTE